MFIIANLWHQRRLSACRNVLHLVCGFRLFYFYRHPDHQQHLENRDAADQKFRDLAEAFHILYDGIIFNNMVVP